MDHDTNGWAEWKNHILLELKRFNEALDGHTKADAENFEKLTALITTLKIDITTLKTKAGVWGSIAGIVSSVAIAIAVALLGK
jgi:hypothetical protein